jgi:DMSO/TMAO reductase YedYZ molybdopterin-dependent catalytic subunit
MVLLSTTLGGLSLPQEFGSALLALMPPPMFAFLHQFIGENAKYDFFLIVLIGQCAVFALAGALFNHYANRHNEPLRSQHGLVLALALWLFTGLLLLPLAGSGIFGANLTVGLTGGMLSLAAVGLTFGLLFTFVQRWLVAPTRAHPAAETEAEDGSVRPTRRVLLKQGAIALGVAAVGLGLWEFIAQGLGHAARVPVARLLQGYRSKIIPPPVPAYGTIQPAPLLSSEITPNDQYYIVSKNFTDPTVSEREWSLKITGLVEQPYTLLYRDLLALPMHQQYESMECISNEVGGSYMSNALWQGVRLADLLAKAGVRPAATKIVLHAYDNYTDSIHLSKALEPTTLVAVRMNNATLPDGHGYPARVLVPGIYGMKHIKWLTQIEVVNYDFQGYWQQRGWSDAAPVRLNARIDIPLDGSQVQAHHPTYVAGVAFSGNLGISEVDVSLDGGKTWQVATLKRPLSPLTWVLWELAWVPEPGTYSVVVRAIDMQGNVQSPQEEPTLPDGASGYHTVGVSVS